MARMSAPAPPPTFSPLYRQIKSIIVGSLDAGEWKPGEVIPSETELAARYGVSQGTVRKAIDELAAENIVVRRQGKGTFVATYSEQRQLFRFLRLVPDAGDQEYPGSRLLECRRARAPADVARLLDLKAGEGIVFIRRALLFQDLPTVLDEISLPATLFKGLTAAKYEEYRGSVYRLLEAEFGTRMIRADERIRAVAADAAAAATLELPEGTPLLCVDRVSFTYGGRPVEYRRGLCRTDRHSYRNELG
jgi:GntR family transcriptional regulator